MTIKAEISNFYEDLVVDFLINEYSDQGFSKDEFNDIACLALNHLPARYYRHSVDMAFFLTTPDRIEMRERVQKAVDEAVLQVLAYRDDSDDERT